MTLRQVLDNSQYITDEDIETANLVGMANNGISEVNSKVKTNLPLCTVSNLTEDYWALESTWFLRLMEPYVSFAIMANDGDSVRQEHYQRFLDALNDFKNNGLGDIASVYPEGHAHAGEPTGFAGKSGKKAGGLCPGYQQRLPRSQSLLGHFSLPQQRGAELHNGQRTGSRSPGTAGYADAGHCHRSRFQGDRPDQFLGR